MTNGQKPKVALIDSVNVAIQVPISVWENINVVMQNDAHGKDYTVVDEMNDEGNWEIRIPNKNCKEMWPILKPIQFNLDNTTVIINSRGYTYQMDEDQDFCQIGLQIIKEGGTADYIFGNIFLRNFVTAFDYDKNVIMFGVNKRSEQLQTTSIEGHTVNPYMDDNQDEEDPEKGKHEDKESKDDT